MRVGAPRDIRPPRKPDPWRSRLFVRAVVEAFPYLPVEEEGRLADPRLGGHFVERAFAY